MIQKTKPNTEVSPDVAARLPALRSRSWLLFQRASSVSFSPECVSAGIASPLVTSARSPTARARTGGPQVTVW